MHIQELQSSVFLTVDETSVHGHTHIYENMNGMENYEVFTSI